MRGDIIPYNLISNWLNQISISKNLMGLVAGVACNVALATNYSKPPGRGCILVEWDIEFYLESFCSFMRCTGGFVFRYCFIYLNEDYIFLKKII